MKTTYHAYSFDIRKPADAKAWSELRARLMETHPHRMKSHDGGRSSFYHPELDSVEVELETSSLFDNQWNTAPLPGHDKGLRVFDWAQDYILNATTGSSIKRGHYLDQTPEMREARRNTNKCGYCGKQEPAAKGYVFCPHCIDSEYLTEAQLPLTRMVPVRDTNKPRAELTDAERAHLLPLFKDAQIHGSTERGKARIERRRRDIEAKYSSAIVNATAERDGARWLIDRAPQMLDNWIYYSHTGRHCFGWRKPLDNGPLSALLDIISEFPFAYDIKTADGRTLSGD